MSLWLLDSGNSRLKWAMLREPYRRGQAFAVQGVLELKGLGSPAAAFSRLFGGAAGGATMYACNVAGPVIERRIRAAAKRAGFAAPHFVRCSAEAAGVRNGYKEPWRLGADRWAALIGARHEYPGRALCIVSIGTAMTIDLLAGNGQHRGGIITPGPLLMIESLLEHTAGVRRRAGGERASRSFERVLARPWPREFAARTAARAAAAKQQGLRSGLYARDTHSALLAGARYATAALIERALTEGRRQLGRKPQLILAGGAADAIAPLLSGPRRRADDLVLRGLAVLAAGPEAP